MNARRAIGIGALTAALLGSSAGTAQAGIAVPAVTERISVRNDGSQAESFTASRASTVSADGRYVAFLSTAKLTPGDTDSTTDVFVRDRVAGTTERISVDSDGVGGNGHSGRGMNTSNPPPSISADGRYVAFESDATNLYGNDGNGSTPDVYVRDRAAGVTQRLAYYGYSPAISGDGAYVTWEWEGTIYRRLRISPYTTHIVVSGGAFASISNDGRYVAFQSQYPHLPGDTNGWEDIYVRDLTTNALERVSVDSNEQGGANRSLYPSISADGQVVAFHSISALVPDDTSCCSPDIYVRDRASGTTERANVASSGRPANVADAANPSLSPDGRYVTFDTAASNLAAGDTNGATDVFVRDRLARTTGRVSVASDGSQASGFDPAVSNGGRVIAFSSTASNLVPGDTNGGEDAFARDIGRRHRCDDGIDNDADGLIDLIDVGCGATDDDDESDEPTASIAGVSVGESAGVATLTVTLTAPSDYAVSANWTTADGTASSPDDFTSASGTLAIAPGEISAEIVVSIAGDDLDEANESFSVSLSDLQNALVGTGTAVVDVIDDDVAMISISDAEIIEGDAGSAAATFAVSLSNPSVQTITMDVATADGTAVAPGDYAASSATLTLGPGDTLASFAVLVTGDTIDETSETFAVALSNVTGGTIADGAGIGTIVDDDRDGWFTCRATALRGAGEEHVIAGSTTDCIDQKAIGASQLVVVAGADAPVASTSVAPDDVRGTDPAAGDGASATSSIARAWINAGGDVVLDGLVAQARMACVASDDGLAAVATASSSVASLQIGSMPPIPIGDAAMSIPLGDGAVLHLNHEIATGGTITRRAAWMESPAGDVVLAEATAGVTGNPCSG